MTPNELIDDVLGSALLVAHLEALGDPQGILAEQLAERDRATKALIEALRAEGGKGPVNLMPLARKVSFDLHDQPFADLSEADAKAKALAAGGAI